MSSGGEKETEIGCICTGEKMCIRDSLQTVKGNIDQILRRSEPQRRKEQSHER